MQILLGQYSVDEIGVGKASDELAIHCEYPWRLALYVGRALVENAELLAVQERVEHSHRSPTAKAFDNDNVRVLSLDGSV